MTGDWEYVTEVTLCFNQTLNWQFYVELFLFQVTMVRWNEPYQKLASCDSTGIIFVWIKYEGRWSIELINDRNTPVTSFSWSHDGRMALICYQVGAWSSLKWWDTLYSIVKCTDLYEAWCFLRVFLDGWVLNPSIQKYPEKTSSSYNVHYWICLLWMNKSHGLS